MRPLPETVITCEHGGFEVPKEVQAQFRGAREVLRSHEGWDPGALDVAVTGAAALHAPLFCTRISRLVVECNRSSGHPGLFSRFTRELPAPVRAGLIARYWAPFRTAVMRHIARTVQSAPVDHISVHSFTPILKGVRRDFEIGILFDPARPRERARARELRIRLLEAEPGWRIRMNRPYRGTSDGFTTFLRTLHVDSHYSGIEIELNQQLLHRTSDRLRIGAALAAAAASRSRPTPEFADH